MTIFEIGSFCGSAWFGHCNTFCSLHHHLCIYHYLHCTSAMSAFFHSSLTVVYLVSLLLLFLVPYISNLYWLPFSNYFCLKHSRIYGFYFCYLIINLIFIIHIIIDKGTVIKIKVIVDFIYIKKCYYLLLTLIIIFF